jgi:predicted HicB family RNase H-like nuclease
MSIESNKKARMIHIRLSEELHRRLRVHVAEMDTSIQEWVKSIIIKNLNVEKE